MNLSPSAARRLRRALAARAHPDEGTGGELNIVPFLDIVTNLLLFLLATVSSVVGVAQVDAQLPATRPGRTHGGAEVPRTVSVTLTEHGVMIGGPSGFVGAGCEGVSPTGAIAVPRGDDRALSTCMTALRERVEDGRVILGADPTIPYEEVLRAMDAIRAQGDRPLFRDILISAGVR